MVRATAAHMRTDAAVTRAIERQNSASRNPPIRFLRRKPSVRTFTAEAMEVARARPLCFMGNMRATLHTVLTMRATTAIRTGVFVSCRA